MPPVVAVAAAVAGAAASVGTAIIGVGAAASIGGLATTVIGGAVVGAVAGGVIAAVKGDNILKGALKGGLIGGVVAGGAAMLGGIGGAAGSAGGTVAETGTAIHGGTVTATNGATTLATTSSTGVAQSSLSLAEAVVAPASSSGNFFTNLFKSGATEGATGSTSSGLLGGDITKAALAKGGMDFVQGYYAGEAADEAAAAEHERTKAKYQDIDTQSAYGVVQNSAPTLQDYKNEITNISQAQPNTTPQIANSAQSTLNLKPKIQQGLLNPAEVQNA